MEALKQCTNCVELHKRDGTSGIGFMTIESGRSYIYHVDCSVCMGTGCVTNEEFYNRMEQKVAEALSPKIDKKINGKILHTTCSFGCQGYTPPHENDAGYILTFAGGTERYLVLIHRMADKE